MKGSSVYAVEEYGCLEIPRQGRTWKRSFSLRSRRAGDTNSLKIPYRRSQTVKGGAAILKKATPALTATLAISLEQFKLLQAFSRQGSLSLAIWSSTKLRALARDGSVQRIVSREAAQYIGCIALIDRGRSTSEGRSKQKV